MTIEPQYIIKADLLGNIKEADAFSTWWNDNCALVITERHLIIPPFNLFVVIYEPPFKKNGENLFSKKIGNYMKLEQAKEKAKMVKEKMSGEKPFLFCFMMSSYSLHPNLPHLFFGDGRIIKIKIGDINNPDDYLRPFDIVRRKAQFSNNLHVAIYLGNKKVVHIFSPPSNNGKQSGQHDLERALAEKRQFKSLFGNFINVSASSSSQRKEENGSGIDYTSQDLWARVDNWENFLDGIRKVDGYHSIFPDKSPSLIIQHLRKSLENNYGKGKYSLIDNNCEHYANLIIHGVNFSQQVDYYPCFSLKERKRFKRSLEENRDETIFKNLGKKRELTAEEIQIFEQLEAKVEIPPKTI